MQGITLFKLLHKDIHTRNKFIGIYSLDILPEINELIQESNKFFLCNTSPSILRGDHWISIFYDSLENNIIFFDPLKEPPAPEFEIFLKKAPSNIPIISIPYRIQSYSSSACAQFSLLFDDLKSQNFKTNSIFKLFTPHNYSANEDLAQSFCLMHYNSRLNLYL